MAVVDGIVGTSFDLTVKEDFIVTADGNTLTIWGFAEGIGNARAQYPGPTLIVNQGDTVTITLKNKLPASRRPPVSIVFPGQTSVTASGGSAGLLTQESTGPGDTVTYTFTATHPGTYLYHSGSEPDLQMEMGLFGALIVRPADPGQAYAHPDTAFDHEYLFVLSEMDPRIHDLVGEGRMSEIDSTDYFPVYWFINGRTGPDTLSIAGDPLLPTQPYNIVPRMHPGERLLMRVIGASKHMHPYHTHGNNFAMIARDGRPLQSAPGAGADLAVSDFTLKTVPGQTYDAIFQWTGEGLGWDIYGHAPGDPMAPSEYAPDHGNPLPVILPETLDLTFGAFYSGSPFLGHLGSLPPGEGGLNPSAGFTYMWHSHTEKELTNFDIFPGGMMSMLIIEPPGVPIP
jgi:FtsP/CotA-like multicopper oxidase with cupredoxin domain